MYDAGAGPYFDIMAMQAYGLWSGPTDQRMHPRVMNFGRPQFVRDVMVTNGDANKPIWISEMGWNTVPAGARPTSVSAGSRRSSRRVHAAGLRASAVRVAVGRRSQHLVFQARNRRVAAGEASGSILPAGRPGLHAPARLRQPEDLHDHGDARSAPGYARGSGLGSDGKR